MSNVEQKLQAMGLKLPACPAPVAAYLPVQTAGNLIYASGQTAWVDGKLLYAGKVGGDVSIADAYESAKISAVNCLSAIATVADLDHIRIVRVHGWVNGVPDFGEHHCGIATGRTLALQIGLELECVLRVSEHGDPDCVAVAGALSCAMLISEASLSCIDRIHWSGGRENQAK